MYSEGFEEEFKILAEWLRQKTREYEKVPVERGYLDSDANAQHRKDVAEYNRRLIALKEKYRVK